MSNYRLIKGYTKDEHYRKCISELSMKTFWLNFEDWYEEGYWTEKNIPYSIFDENDKIVAHLLVNKMDFMWEGKEKHLIQLGTVMTDEKARNQGLIRQLMNEVDQDFESKVDATILYANDTVTEFYPKFGFMVANEYEFYKEVTLEGKQTARLLPMSESHAQKEFFQIVKESTYHYQYELLHNPEMVMFYVMKMLQEHVYYIDSIDTYVIAEIENGELFIHMIFCNKDVKLDDVISAFGCEISRVRLGFTPLDTTGYQMKVVNEEDTTFFVKGKDADEIKRKKGMLPTLSHT